MIIESDRGHKVSGCSFFIFLLVLQFKKKSPKAIPWATKSSELHILHYNNSIGILSFFAFEKKTFELDSSQNTNTLTETKTGMLQLKTKNINDNACDDATDWPVCPNTIRSAHSYQICLICSASSVSALLNSDYSNYVGFSHLMYAHLVIIWYVFCSSFPSNLY